MGGQYRPHTGALLAGVWVGAIGKHTKPTDEGGVVSDFKTPRRPEKGKAAAVARTAQDKAGEGTAVMTEQVSQVTGTAKEQASQVAGEAAAQAKNLAQEVRDQLQNQTHTQTHRLADTLRQLAEELREMSENSKPDSLATSTVRRLADGGQQVASHVENRGPEGLVGDLQDFARRHPGTFLAGAAIAGFTVARLAKGVSSAATPAAAEQDYDPLTTGGHEALPMSAARPEERVPYPEATGAPADYPPPVADPLPPASPGLGAGYRDRPGQVG
jgi:hypothetical protein